MKTNISKEFKTIFLTELESIKELAWDTEKMLTDDGITKKKKKKNISEIEDICDKLEHIIELEE